MDIKSGTKTWSDSVQRTDFKSDGRRTISASDKAELFQGEDLGTTLNKVADPNWIDPSKKMRSVGNPKLDKDAFMTLLLTQMKNQDPTNPMKSHEMAAQLAQFTSLEKLSNIDSGIEKLNTDKNPAQNFEALNFIGKKVVTDSSTLGHTSPNEMHDLSFNLAGDAVKAEIQVKDADGNVVRTLSSNNLSAGKNSLNWNGLMDDGTAAPAGDYTFDVMARSSNGSKIYVETRTEGVVTGVNFTSKGPQVMVGKRVINMADIKSISDPKLSEEAAQKLQPQNKGPLPIPQAKASVKPEADSNGAEKAKLSQGNINDLAMTQGLINKLSKEGAKAGMGNEGG